MLVNQDEILEGIYDGFGMPAIGPLAPGVFGHNESMKPLTYTILKKRKSYLRKLDLKMDSQQQSGQTITHNVWIWQSFFSKN